MGLGRVREAVLNTETGVVGTDDSRKGPLPEEWREVVAKGTGRVWYVNGGFELTEFFWV